MRIYKWSCTKLIYNCRLILHYSLVTHILLQKRCVGGGGSADEKVIGMGMGIGIWIVRVRVRERRVVCMICMNDTSPPARIFVIHSDSSLVSLSLAHTLILVVSCWYVIMYAPCCHYNANNTTRQQNQQPAASGAEATTAAAKEWK